MNKEAKFRLLYQEDLNLHNTVQAAWFCDREKYRIIKFDKILGEKLEDYFSVEFFDKGRGDNIKLSYIIYYDNDVSCFKDISQFEKEDSVLCKEVKDVILSLSNKNNFKKAIKNLFYLGSIPNPPTMDIKFFGF